MTESPEYQAALQYLYSFIDYERSNGWKYDGAHFDLARVREFLAALGSPHEKGRFVHVAGTNGKGSTAAMIAAGLASAGYRTGLYTSPHLITFRERIRIGDELISHREVIEGVERLRLVTASFPGLTFFEVWTGLAFDYFAQKQTDIAVIEVGMGGRLDTTNVIKPLVSVITPVSMDHRRSLGDTIEQIAAEKAGIIKAGVPVVSSPQQPEAAQVIAHAAVDRNAHLVTVGTDVEYVKGPGTLTYRGTHWQFDGISQPLPGSFQSMNAATALATLELLQTALPAVTQEAVRRGLTQVRWPGRLETVAYDPRVIVDGACNPDAMLAVSEFIGTVAPKENVIALVGICRDKEIPAVLAALGGQVSHMVCTQVSNPRALPAEEVASFVPEGMPFTVEPDPEAALAEARRLAGPAGVVIATGSLYLVGEVIRLTGHECEVTSADRLACDAPVEA